MRRRTLLAGMVALAASQVGCQASAEQALRISLLARSLPPKLVQQFQDREATRVALKPQETVADLFIQLQQWQQMQPQTADESAIADFSSLTDYWLPDAIQQGLIQPLPLSNLTQWSTLPSRWRSHIPQYGTHAIWAAPYRWGCLVMVYAQRPFRQFDWRPQHWQDLWRPELAGRVALPDHPRLTLGLALKSLGYSANHPAPQQLSDLQAALKTLKSQVKVYASTYYLQALLQGDIWVAVGWSTDIRPLLSQYRQLQAVVPAPATLLSSDVWVRSGRSRQAPGPALNALPAVAAHWLDYWWQPQTQTPMSLFSGGLSPLLLDQATAAIPAELSSPQMLLPTGPQIKNSDFIERLPAASLTAYTDLWQALRGHE